MVLARLIILVVLVWAAACGAARSVAAAHATPQAASARSLIVERVTTIAPFPRGLAMLDGKLYVLSRGRVRDAGGVSSAVNDQAGTIYAVDPDVTQPISDPHVSQAVRTNGKVLALPSDPPFKLWRRDADPPQSDRETDRPYCTLRYHPSTQSFYICGFSGIDLAERPGQPNFSKNCSDAILRYDLRTNRWHEVERHHLHAGGTYPHHDPAFNQPPHGWLNGPDNILAVGDHLYAAAKDNSLLARYQLAELVDDPNAGFPKSEVIFNENVFVEGLGTQKYYGQSALAAHDGWLYVGYRTSSVIIRLRLNNDGTPTQPIVAQLVAQFDPYDPKTGHSANITDMCFDSRGRLYLMSADGGLVYRFTPDPKDVYDGRSARAQPWLTLGELSGKPKIKCENVFIDDRNRLFITSGDGYGYQHGADGTVYRVTMVD